MARARARCFKAGAFEKYYTTTCEGQRITVTRPHYKGDLAKAFGHLHIRESHFQLPSEDAVAVATSNLCRLWLLNMGFSVRRVHVPHLFE